MYEVDDFSLDLFSLAGKVAIVTGGNTGIGQGIAVALAKVGADLFLPLRSQNGDETKALVEKQGRRAVLMQADLADPDAPAQIIAGCMEAYGRIDVLVNNAGIIRRFPLLEYPDEEWDAVINVNLNALYHLSQGAARVMAEQKRGKIINIASMLSFQGGKFVPAYTASKHAVAGLTKSFASELCALNIQVNAIAPGYIATNNTTAIRADEDRSSEILGRIPAGRWGTPFDLMGAAVFLASPLSDYVTGHILAVDGGWLVR